MTFSAKQKGKAKANTFEETAALVGSSSSDTSDEDSRTSDTSSEDDSDSSGNSSTYDSSGEDEEPEELMEKYLNLARENLRRERTGTTSRVEEIGDEIIIIGDSNSEEQYVPAFPLPPSYCSLSPGPSLLLTLVIFHHRTSLIILLLKMRR